MAEKAYSQYEEMASVFGADFETDELAPQDIGVPAKTTDELKDVLDAKRDLTIDVQNTVTIQDEDYVKGELRLGAEMLTDVAETIRQGLTDEDKPDAWKAFAAIMKERRETLVSLETSNVGSYDRTRGAQDNDTEHTGNVSNTVNNNMVFTSSDALDLVLGAQAQSKNDLGEEV
jgi:hypothetical protein